MSLKVLKSYISNPILRIKAKNNMEIYTIAEKRNRHFWSGFVMYYKIFLPTCNSLCAVL